jgi:Arc/MetJ-type ribon-helix-helix transcriptional regulator
MRRWYDNRVILKYQIMKQKIAISLDADLINFVDLQANGNRSEYINALLAQQRRRQLEAELIAALQQDLADAEYQNEIAEWDSLAGDGIDATG